MGVEARTTTGEEELERAVRETVLGASILELEVEVDESSRVESWVEEREEEAEEER